VLVGSGCAFKVAVGLPQLSELLSVTADRRSSGKVITAYPVDEAQFVALAEQLHRATEHLPGPVILSDRPVRPGSLVHCRYGAFTGRRMLSNDGSFESVLSVPGGGVVRDDRRVGLIAPPWAPCLLPAEPPRAASGPQAPRAGAPILLAGRFVVGQAIRQANKGGVYLATDRQTGGQVVIKEARPHVGTLLDGTDVRDRLRHEAILLQRLAPFGLTRASC
jgi:hypothetical protein